MQLFHLLAKSPKLPAFIDEKDELDSYLLCFERYAENASWEKNSWAITLSATDKKNLRRLYQDVNYRLQWLRQVKESTLNQVQLRQRRFREVKPETGETPDHFVIRLKNYIAKLLELFGSSSGDFDA